MDYEKKFKDLLDRIQGLLDNAKKQGYIIVRVEDLENAFPELQESEDERIRKNLLGYIKGVDEREVCKETLNEWIAWLEKQGQVKEYTFKSIPRLLEMIEPTKKAIAYCQKLIDTLINEGYAVDAKIVCKCLKKMCGEEVALATMDEKQDQVKEDDDSLTIDDKINNKIIEHIIEALQRYMPKNDFLLYEKLEMISWLEKQSDEKQSEQKSIWSEEDEKMLNHIIGLLEGLPNLHNWLKSLKDRIQP